MRILLAIKSCARDKELETIQRKTFLSGSSIEYKFFRGDEHFSAKDDVISLPVADDYISLAFKTKSIAKWAVDNDYDYV